MTYKDAWRPTVDDEMLVCEKAINIMGMLMIASIKKAPGHVPPN